MAIDDRLSGNTGVAEGTKRSAGHGGAVATGKEARSDAVDATGSGSAARTGGLASGAAPKPGTSRPGRSPAWLVPLYLAGLALIYLGERVFVELDRGRLIIEGVGLGCLIAATLARFYSPWKSGGDRASIERLLSLLSVLGLMGVGVYFLSDRLNLPESTAETRERIQTVLTIGWMSLIALTVVPMAFAEAALYPMRDAERLESRRVHAAAGSGFVLALAALYGSLFVYAASKAEAQVDYSYFKTSEPGTATRRLVENVNEKLRITAFFADVSDVRPEINHYLTKLVEGLPNVEVRMSDRYLEPELAKKSRVNQDGVILFEREDQQQQLTVPTELSLARKKLRNLDKEVNETLLKLLRVRRSTYVTVGHGEIFEKSGSKTANPEELRSGKILKELIEQLNYRVKNLGIAEGLGNDVPDDATIVAVVGPTEPFAAEELESLRRYVARGGKLLLALDADSFSNQLIRENLEQAGATPSGANPGGNKEALAAAETTKAAGATGAEPATPAAGDAAFLDSLRQLADLVGLKYNPTVLANETRHVRRRNNDSDRTLIPSQRFSSHASVSTVGRRRNGVLFAGAGSISVDADPPGGRKVDFAVKALQGTFVDKNGNFKEDVGEKESNLNLVAAVTDDTLKKPEPVGEEDKKAAERRDKRTDPTPPEMRAFVIADADALTDLVMSRFGENQLFIYDAIRWLGGEESLAGTVNDEEDVRIEHTKQKDLFWFYSTMIAIPGLVLGLGLIYSRASRSKKGAHA